MSIKRRVGWAVGVGLANALIFSKGFPTLTEELVAFLVGAVVGLILSFAAQGTSTKSAARMKMLYWPVALSIFWTFLDMYPRTYGSQAIWMFAGSTFVGFLIGGVHCLVLTWRLREASNSATNV